VRSRRSGKLVFPRRFSAVVLLFFRSAVPCCNTYILYLSVRSVLV
jgi:hypothetical protein